MNNVSSQATFSNILVYEMVIRVEHFFEQLVSILRIGVPSKLRSVTSGKVARLKFNPDQVSKIESSSRRNEAVPKR
jgi:hypothetical protein